MYDTLLLFFVVNNGSTISKASFTSESVPGPTSPLWMTWVARVCWWTWVREQLPEQIAPEQERCPHSEVSIPSNMALSPTRRTWRSCTTSSTTRGIWILRSTPCCSSRPPWAPRPTVKRWPRYVWDLQHLSYVCSYLSLTIPVWFW